MQVICMGTAKMGADEPLAQWRSASPLALPQPSRSLAMALMPATAFFYVIYMYGVAGRFQEEGRLRDFTTTTRDVTSTILTGPHNAAKTDKMQVPLEHQGKGVQGMQTWQRRRNSRNETIPEGMQRDPLVGHQKGRTLQADLSDLPRESAKVLKEKDGGADKKELLQAQKQRGPDAAPSQCRIEKLSKQAHSRKECVNEPKDDEEQDIHLTQASRAKEEKGADQVRKRKGKQDLLVCPQREQGQGDREGAER